MDRHKRLVNVMAKCIRGFSRVAATVAGEIQTSPNTRGDIKVMMTSGVEWVLDLGVACPATPARVNGSLRAHLVPGAVAEHYHKDKQTKYDNANVENAIPFIIESGGRLSAGACRFVDDVLVDRECRSDSLVAHKLFRQISWNLADNNGWQMSKLAMELPQPDLAV